MQLTIWCTKCSYKTGVYIFVHLVQLDFVEDVAEFTSHSYILDQYS